MSFQEKQSKIFLKHCPTIGSITLTILLSVLLFTMAHHFTCPCRNDQNTLLIVSLFIGPAFLVFVFMFLILRPLRYGWFYCPKGLEDDTRKNCPKALIWCLIPPAMWIIFLLLDGDHVACAMTDWEGVSVTDELNMKWCKPTEGMRNEMELHNLTGKYVLRSQYLGYVLIAVFSAFSLAVVSIYDSCISGKCDRCPSPLLLFCGRTVRYSRGNRQDDVEHCSPTSSITTHPLIALSKNE